MKFNIKFITIQDIHNFVRVIDKYKYDADITSGRYKVNARSIMGIFSLDLFNPVELTIHDVEECDMVNIENDMKAFVV